MAPVTDTGDVLGGRYRVGELIGRGGMAEVWQAWDERLRRWVAVKLFADAGSETDAARAAGEMHTLAALSHPNLVTVFDAGETGGRAFLVMELVTGSTLASRIDTRPLDDRTVAAIGRDVAAGLDHIHRRGIVHRDVKPANILLPSPDHDDVPMAKLADFGIAQHADQTRITRTGTTVGTARYLAREQIAGQRVGPPADVYALGLVLLDALGAGPDWSGTPVEVAVARLANPPEVPTRLGPRWAPLLTAMTASDPQARPTAAQARVTLADLAGAAPTELDPTSPMTPTPTLLIDPPAGGRGRRPWLIGVTAAVAVGAVATAVVVALSAGSGGAGPAGGGSTTPSTPSTSAPDTPAATTSAPSATDPGPTEPGPGGPAGHTPPGQTKSKGKDKPGK